MLQYVTRRLLYTFPVLLGVSLIVFLLFHWFGGNPVYHMLPKSATPETIAAMERQLGLDKPMMMQFWEHLKGNFTFDFGRSWETKQRISTMIAQGILPSLSLALPAFVIGSTVSILVALISAFYHRRWPDRLLVIVSVLGMSVSILAFIIAGQYIFAFEQGLFPISGWEPGLEGLPYLALPILIWVTASLGQDVRYYRTVFLEEQGRDYVTTARAKGLSNRRTMLVHVLKNAMIPIITRMVLTLPFLFTGSLLLENFFGIPGLGNMSINALNASDFPVIKAMTFVGALLYVAANLLGDILYSLVDPRVRLE